MPYPTPPLARERVRATPAEIADSLQVMIKEIEGRRFDRTSTSQWMREAAMLKGALTLFAACRDGMSNEKRVAKVQLALDLLKGKPLPPEGSSQPCCE